MTVPATRPASFRGASFEVEARSLSTGRRVHLHEYPLRDKPYAEDLGKKALSFTVTGFVVGKDYAAKRDALKDACLKKGSGRLVHPDFGTVSVLCTELNIRESKDRGGMAVFEMTFAEAGEDAAIRAAARDGKKEVALAAASLRDKTKTSFLKSFRAPLGGGALTKVITSLASNAETPVRDAISAVSVANLSAADAKSAMSRALDALSLASSMKRDANSLFRTPASLISQTDELISLSSSLATLTASSANARNPAFATVLDLAPNTAEDKTGSDAEREAAALYVVAVSLFILAAAAETLTANEDLTHEEALDLMERFVAAADEVELSSPPLSDAERAELLSLKERVVSYARDVLLKLPTTTTITLTRSKPSLVLAYELYADASRADEICRKNAVPYPAFVPAGRALKVAAS